MENKYAKSWRDLNVDQLITLSQANQLGYGSQTTLQTACWRGKLECVKLGRDWVTTEKHLLIAGYLPTESVDNT